MATGSDDLTREDFDALTEALKKDDFRKLLLEYCDEINDPANKILYRRELSQLERERGYVVNFVDPTPGYSLKTSSSGERKAFINVCSNATLDRPSFWRSIAGRVEWRLPYSLTPPRDDYDKNTKRCVTVDVVFHPNCIALASRSKPFKDMLTKTALEAVEQNHRLNLDLRNVKQPKQAYKGTAVAAVIRTPDPDYEIKPDAEPELLERLYPQKIHKNPPVQVENVKDDDPDDEYTIPKYTVKQRRDIEMKEFTYELDSKRYSAIPSSIVVEVRLPLLSSASQADLDVTDKRFVLVSHSPARYRLDIDLPYRVDSDSGSAKFDVDKRILTVVLPAVPEKVAAPWDSGVESDANSPCHSDEDNSASLTTEPSTSPGIEVISESEAYRTRGGFFHEDISYVIPSCSSNVFDNLLVLTLDVKNVDSDSLSSEETCDGVQVKFESIGAGFFPIHYGFRIVLPDSSKFGSFLSEVWDNNVILQLNMQRADNLDHILIGVDTFERHDLEKSISTLGEITTNINNAELEEAVNSDTLSEDFLLYDLCYTVPQYSLNVLDNILAFTFHIRNVENKSFHKQFFSDKRGMRIKFSSRCGDDILHYALCLKLPNEHSFKDYTLDIWKSNTVLRLEVENDTLPSFYHIGLSDFNLNKQYFETTVKDIPVKEYNNAAEPTVEIVATGINEMSISLHKNEDEEIPNDVGVVKSQQIPKLINYNLDNCSGSGSFKGILKCKATRIGRSLSESYVDMVDYNVSPVHSVSSVDCIPEESSSVKKTVRFSDVITKQTFRTNSSILGQKSKNQRKKRNKKRAQVRRSSEGDPSDIGSLDADNEDVFMESGKKFKEHMNVQRRDSGLVDTDDADSDKGENDENNASYINEKHPSYKNKDKGKYQEVNFKNDLIFDLDM